MHKLDLDARARGGRAAQQGDRALSRAARTPAPASCSSDLLVAEEESIDWLEAQLKIVKDIGRERYLVRAAPRLAKGSTRFLRWLALAAVVPACVAALPYPQPTDVGVAQRGVAGDDASRFLNAGVRST